MYFLKLLTVLQGRAGVVGARSEERDGGVRSDAEERRGGGRSDSLHSAPRGARLRSLLIRTIWLHGPGDAIFQPQVSEGTLRRSSSAHG